MAWMLLSSVSQINLETLRTWLALAKCWTKVSLGLVSFLLLPWYLKLLDLSHSLLPSLSPTWYTHMQLLKLCGNRIVFSYTLAKSVCWVSTSHILSPRQYFYAITQYLVPQHSPLPFTGLFPISHSIISVLYGNYVTNHLLLTYDLLGHTHA